MTLDKIRRLYPQLTRSQKRIAAYISTSYHQVAFMTASVLARQLNMNEATIIRFAQRLDYQGYPEFIASIQEIVKKELSASRDKVQAAALDEPLLKMLASEDEFLRRAISHFPVETGTEMLAAIQDATRVFVLGQGMASHLAGILDCGLRMQGYDTRLVPGDPLSLSAIMGTVLKDDVVIGLCVENSSAQIAQALQFAHDAGCRTFALSCSPISQVAQAADLALSCPATDLFELPSVTVLAAFIDALVQILALRHRDALSEHHAHLALARSRIAGQNTPRSG